MAIMNNQRLLARLCGLTYVILIVSGIFGIAHVPASLIAWDNPAATIENIKTSELLFRVGILSEIICFVAFIFLPLLLHKLLSPVNKTAAMLMVVLALISVPLSLVGVVQHIQVIHLVNAPAYLHDVELLQAGIMSALALANSGAVVTNIFAGLWLLPFGYLVLTSGFLPRLLGVLLILGCFGYLYEFFAGFVFNSGATPWYIGVAGNLGVFITALWLLLAGVSNRSTKGYELAQ